MGFDGENKKTFALPPAVTKESVSVQLESSLAAYRAKIADLENEVSALEARKEEALKTQSDDIEQKKQELDLKRGKLSDDEKNLAERILNLKAQEADLEMRRAALDALIENKESGFKKDRDNIESQIASIQERETALNKKDNLLSSKERDLLEVERNHKEKEHFLALEFRGLKERDEEVEAKKLKIAEEEARVSSLLIDANQLREKNKIDLLAIKNGYIEIDSERMKLIEGMAALEEAKRSAEQKLADATQADRSARILRAEIEALTVDLDARRETLQELQVKYEKIQEKLIKKGV